MVLLCTGDISYLDETNDCLRISLLTVMWEEMWPPLAINSNLSKSLFQKDKKREREREKSCQGLRIIQLYIFDHWSKIVIMHMRILCPYWFIFCHLIWPESLGSTPILEVRLFMHNYLASPAAPRALAAVIISLLPQKHKAHNGKTVKSFPLCPWVAESRGVERVWGVQSRVREKYILRWWEHFSIILFADADRYSSVWLPWSRSVIEGSSNK